LHSPVTLYLKYSERILRRKNSAPKEPTAIKTAVAPDPVFKLIIEKNIVISCSETKTHSI
jgi:hypothetical protein